MLSDGFCIFICRYRSNSEDSIIAFRIYIYMCSVYVYAFIKENRKAFNIKHKNVDGWGRGKKVIENE